MHTGHKFLIEKAKKQGAVVCVISGNFVQRGDTAIYEKQSRAQAALLCGADLVIELPVYYSMSTAQNFALGGVSLLDAIGCDTLMFGSECGNTDDLVKTCDVLRSEEFSRNLTPYLEKGITFAAARQKAAESIGAPKGILNGANNNLGIEYIGAIKDINSKMKFETVRRLGAMHDSDDMSNAFVSASALREKIKQGKFSDCKTYFPQEVINLFETADYSDIFRIETAILASLRTKEQNDFEILPDLSEGMENKLFSQIKLANSLEDLYNGMKVKRYTMARIRRLVLSAFLSVDNSMFLKTPPYLRVLGFNKTGEEILKQNAKNSKIPVIMRVSEIDALPDDAKKVFKAECRATDLYALSLKKPIACSLEYTRKLIKL